MPKKTDKQSVQESVRYQITLKDPQTNSFMSFFSHRKSELVQAALEQYMMSDNRHTRELQAIMGCKQADIDRLRYTLGASASQNFTEVVPRAEKILESPRMPAERPDLPFNLGEAAEEEEIFGDIDI